MIAHPTLRTSHNSISTPARLRGLSIARYFGICTACLALWCTDSHLYASPKTNDLRALNSIREIYRAEIEYESTYPANGFACSLTALGGDPKLGSSGPMAAQLISTDLASGIDNGYIFKITECQKETINGIEKAVSFKVTAIPQIPGKTGIRSFCHKESGELTADPEGGAHCTVTLIK
ncbi:MAG: prepilin-type cleavage/methylation domain-containing protein [Terracidiphilus sp.]|jgi:type IV pilus assembly protein PilA